MGRLIVEIPAHGVRGFRCIKGVSLVTLLTKVQGMKKPNTEKAHKQKLGGYLRSPMRIGGCVLFKYAVSVLKESNDGEGSERPLRGYRDIPVKIVHIQGKERWVDSLSLAVGLLT